MLKGLVEVKQTYKSEEILKISDAPLKASFQVWRMAFM